MKNYYTLGAYKLLGAKRRLKYLALTFNEIPGASIDLFMTAMDRVGGAWYLMGWCAQSLNQYPPTTLFIGQVLRPPSVLFIHKTVLEVYILIITQYFRILSSEQLFRTSILRAWGTIIFKIGSLGGAKVCRKDRFFNVNWICSPLVTISNHGSKHCILRGVVDTYMYLVI